MHLSLSAVVLCFVEKLSLKQLGNQVREGIVQDHGTVSARGPGVRYWAFPLSHATSSEGGKLAREGEALNPVPPFRSLDSL